MAEIDTKSTTGRLRWRFAFRSRLEGGAAGAGTKSAGTGPVDYIVTHFHYSAAMHWQFVKLGSKVVFLFTPPYGGMRILVRSAIYIYIYRERYVHMWMYTKRESVQICMYIYIHIYIYHNSPAANIYL